MRWHTVAGWVPWALVVAVALSAAPARAQVLQAPAGVVVDAQGVLHKKLFPDPGGRLTRQRIAAARASLAPDVAAVSPLRCVSLNRLEKAIRDRQGVPTDEMRQSGRTAARALRLLLSGVEGHRLGRPGRGLGHRPGRPRRGHHQRPADARSCRTWSWPCGRFRPAARRRAVIGCSIDPTQEGLAAMQQFLAERRFVRHAGDDAQTQYIVEGLQTEPGHAERHGRRRVAEDALRPGHGRGRLPDEADRHRPGAAAGAAGELRRSGQPGQVSRNALFRWYFMPDYQCVRVSDDGLAMELVGDGVKLVGEDELVVTAGGTAKAGRSNSARARRS